MNSLIFLACMVVAMFAGFLLGSFYRQQSSQIDINYWKAMYDLERDHRKATDVIPPEGGRMPPPLPESEADRMSAS